MKSLIKINTQKDLKAAIPQKECLKFWISSQKGVVFCDIYVNVLMRRCCVDPNLALHPQCIHEVLEH